MSRFPDQQYLMTDQYRDSSNLEARLVIHQRFSTNPYGWFNWVFDRLVQLPENVNILELGCGSGILWKECASRIPTGWVVTLSDLSDGMLDAAWRNLATVGRTFKLEQIDAQFIPYEDGKFDAVIANHMLYHIPDRQKALFEIKRVLKENGRLIATTVGDNHMKEVNAWLRRVTIEKDRVQFSQLFTLENGLCQLEEFFSKVEISRYLDGLKVAEIEPLMAYIRSAIHSADLSLAELAKIEVELTAFLECEGKIPITKDSGLFEAVK